MRLRSSVIETHCLTAEERQRMFELMQNCYENVYRDKFEEDLNAKWLVILVHEPSTGKLVGFSTQVMLKTIVGTSPVNALFSGDTIVEPAHWGDPALAHEWGQLALRLIDQFAPDSLYWFLTSKGFRTYRYLPLFFRQYAPRADEELTPENKSIIDTMGRLVAGSRYDCSSQIIRSTSVSDFVRRGVSEPGARLGSNRHICFFVDRNPGYECGDELCCLAPLSRQNFTTAAYRVIRAGTAGQEAVRQDGRTVLL